MISVIIPVYNEEAYIETALRAVFSNTVLPDEVIVADGGSTDQTVDIIKKNFPFVKVVNNPNRNAASGRNVAIKHARGDILAFTDGDCVVSHDWIEKISDAFNRHTIDGLGGKVVAAKPINRIEKYWGNLAWNIIMSFGDESYVVTKCTLNDAFVTANCAYTRKLIDQLDGFSEWFANNAEDVDFSWRALKANAKLMYVPEVLIHAHNITTIKGVIRKSFRNGVSSSKLQKRHGYKINFDPTIYRLLARNLVGILKREEDAGLNVIELVFHLLGKYYGSVKVKVINI